MQRSQSFISSSNLFSTPSFLLGFAHAVDIGNTLSVYNDAASADEADLRAISSDWRLVGADISKAMGNFNNGDQ